MPQGLVHPGVDHPAGEGVDITLSLVLQKEEMVRLDRDPTEPLVVTLDLLSQNVVVTHDHRHALRDKPDHQALTDTLKGVTFTRDATLIHLVAALGDRIERHLQVVIEAEMLHGTPIDLKTANQTINPGTAGANATELFSLLTERDVA